jgi:hypothetical protein
MQFEGHTRRIVGCGYFDLGFLFCQENRVSSFLEACTQWCYGSYTM